MRSVREMLQESSGEFITIERQISSCDYYCRFGITRELFLSMSSRNMLMQLLKHMKKKKAGTIKTGKNVFFF